jgi:transcriptional regulator with XRE-family HTH domain
MGSPTTRLGEMIRHARKRAGLRLEDVADQVGVTPGALSHIESGRRLPQPHNAVLIAEVLGIPSEELLLALDEEHSSRRRGSVDSWRSSGGDRTSGTVYREMPIERLFDGSRAEAEAMQRGSRTTASQSMHSAMPVPSSPAHSVSSPARSMARWSDVTADRISALDELAATASEAIRTLRGLLGDDDPTVAHEAARLLRELDVRSPDE